MIRSFDPEVGSYLTVTLPGERMRCEVIETFIDGTVRVKLGQPMTRNHRYDKGDKLFCHRIQESCSAPDQWLPITEDDDADED